ncbi:uncharacterized protein [Diabrotica undecimpunctata]|uniref:uncharacterized protein isoform X2 n=1 Tax=Diabrotica undecimpunctata TaxID=50387 RepID=UPI003B63FEF5
MEGQEDFRDSLNNQVKDCNKDKDVFLKNNVKIEINSELEECCFEINDTELPPLEKSCSEYIKREDHILLDNTSLLPHIISMQDDKNEIKEEPEEYDLRLSPVDEAEFEMCDIKTGSNEVPMNLKSPLEHVSTHEASRRRVWK